MPDRPVTDSPGLYARTPLEIPASGWKQILLRCWNEASHDNLSLIASGVAFYAILAMVPILGAIVLVYGLVASPETVASNIRSLTGMLPADAASLVGKQLASVVKTSAGSKGFGLVVALLIAMYGVMKAALALITALNIAYDEEESRGIVRIYLLALAMAAGGVLLALVAIVAIAAMASLDTLFPRAPHELLVLGRLAPYLIIGAAGIGLAGSAYRFGPNRTPAQWSWLSPGSIFASASSILITFGFGVYVANFGNYDATYGSLGAVVVLLTWLYLSSYALLLGAEINCEMERQTAHDTTTGPERPMGERGAFAADTIAAEP